MNIKNKIFYKRGEMILVTGATGRIGGTLIPMLLEKNYKIRAIVIPGDKGKEALERINVECIEAKLEDDSIYDSILNGVSVVFHLAATMFQDWVTNDITFKVNIRGTFNLLNAIAVNGIKLERFIFASSDQVYPSLLAKYSPIDENHPTEPYCVYGLSKLFGEHLCRIYLKEQNIPTVCPRFTMTTKGEEYLEPYGKLSDLLYIKPKLEKLKNLKSPSSEVRNLIKQFEKFLSHEEDGLYIPCDHKGEVCSFPFTDPRDIAKGLLLLLKNNKAVGEAFNFGPPDSYPLNEVVEYLAKRKHLSFIKVNMPSSPFEILSNVVDEKFYTSSRKSLCSHLLT